nr:zinc finger, SWIM-type [Tanacetum cinerariifolium]
MIHVVGSQGNGVVIEEIVEDNVASKAGKKARLLISIMLQYNYMEGDVHGAIRLNLGSTFWPKRRIPSVLLPQNHHVPIGRREKRIQMNKDKDNKVEKELKMTVEDGKLSRKGKIGACSKCGAQALQEKGERATN